MLAWHLEIPTKSMGVGNHSMDISIIFCRIGRKPLKDLAKRILYILSIFILKYVSIFILMKAVSVPWEEFFYTHFYIPCGFFCFLRKIFTWSKMARQIKSFRLLQFFFKHREQCFTTWNGARDFSPHIFRSEKIAWLKWCNVFCSALIVPEYCAELGWCSANHSAVGVPLYGGWVIGPPSISVCWNGLHAAFTWHGVFPVSPAGPYNTIPTTTSYQHQQSYYLLARIQWKIGATSNWDRQEKMNVAVLNQPKMQRKISLPQQREREWGKEWAKPESSGALPKPLEACDRSLFYPSTREIGSLCLIHSWTVSDSNSYLCRDAVKHIRIEWFVLHTQAHTHTHYLQHLHLRCIEIPAAL